VEHATTTLLYGSLPGRPIPVKLGHTVTVAVDSVCSPLRGRRPTVLRV